MSDCTLSEYPVLLKNWEKKELSLIHPPVNQSVATFLFLKIRRSELGKPLTVFTSVAVYSQILTITLQFLYTTRMLHIVLKQNVSKIKVFFFFFAFAFLFFILSVWQHSLFLFFFHEYFFFLFKIYEKFLTFFFSFLFNVFALMMSLFREFLS